MTARGCDLPAEVALSAAETRALEALDARLLLNRARSYTQGDSTSITEEVAERLRASVWFTLGYWAGAQADAEGVADSRERALRRILRAAGENDRAAGEGDFRDDSSADAAASYVDAAASRADAAASRADALLRAGQALLENAVEDARAQLRAVVRYACPVGNRAYADTLTEWARFFRRYDLRFFAQELPCSVDYPLMRPTDEHLRGMEYALCWLTELRVENALTARFPADAARAVLLRYVIDPLEALVNVCEPLAVNAIGCALTGCDPRALNVPREVSDALAERLCGMPEDAALALTLDAAGRVSRALDVSREEYALLADAARAVVPRMLEAARAGSLSRVFLQTNRAAT